MDEVLEKLAWRLECKLNDPGPSYSLQDILKALGPNYSVTSGGSFLWSAYVDKHTPIDLRWDMAKNHLHEQSSDTIQRLWELI